MSVLKPVPWVAFTLYVAVLVAGGYAGLAGLGETRPALFVGGLAGAAVLDVLERRRFPVRTPSLVAVALLVARTSLFLVVAAGDGSGLSRVLFLLLPFTAYFAFGPVVSVALGLVCVGLVAVIFQLTIPDWYGQVEQVSDLLMFCVGLVLTIAMAAVAAEEQRGRARLEAYAAQVADLSTTAERNRLARDIHDGLGHHLTAIAVLLEKAATFRDRDAATADRALDDARESTRRALDDVRRSVRALHAESSSFSLATALDDLIRDADERPAVTVEYAGQEGGHDRDALMALYRAAQEGITNARRHASATRVSVTVHCDESMAQLTVTDDGLGFAPEREGFGLLGMRERVRLTGGSVDVASGPGHGTRLTVTIPRRSTS